MLKLNCSLVVVFFSALELEPAYLKAILRRAQASEALEKYDDALNGVLLIMCLLWLTLSNHTFSLAIRL